MQPPESGFRAKSVDWTNCRNAEARFGVAMAGTGCGRDQRKTAMSPAPYPTFNWFFRAARMLPLVAAAALGGGIIGGGAILAIDLAITSPPQHDAESAKVETPAPIRTVDAPKPETLKPSADTSPATVAAPAITSASTAPTSPVAATPSQVPTVPVTQSTAIGVVTSPTQTFSSGAPAAGTLGTPPQNAAAAPAAASSP